MATVSDEIKELEKRLQEMKARRAQDKWKIVQDFDSKINNLISSTATGELRNELTDLNILFNQYRTLSE